MIQGTMSNAGKSLLCAGLCRIFKQDGYRVAPFKSQNMALNSFITEDGLEMGRAQVVQAEAAGVAPQVEMNPILLKPTNDVGSQVIVNGEVLKNMSAREYFAYKKQLIPDIMKAFHKLEEENDIIVIEGAGSPAEINAPGVNLRYVKNPRELENPDMIILPGTKNTMGDLKWLRQSGMEAKILKAHAGGCVVWGICGGYQMLGQSLSDPEGVEDGGSMKGLGLLPVTTTFTTEKTRTRVNGTLLHVEGNLKALENLKFEGYEIHMGKTELLEGCPMNQIHDTVKKKDRQIPDMEPENRIENSTDGISHGNVYGTYIHGIFDKEKIVSEIVKSLAEKKGLSMEEVEGVDLKAFKESQYDLLADTLRKHLDMKAIYQIMGMQK